MQWDGVEANVSDVDPRSCALDLLQCPPVVEGAVGQVDADGCAVLLKHRRDKDVVAVEELVLDDEGVLVLWVVEKQRIKERQTSLSLAVECSVDVVEQAVANIDGIAGCCASKRPAVKFLGD